MTSILNFAPALISVPEGVSVRKVDLAVELQILSFYQQRRAGRLPDGPRRRRGGPIAPSGPTAASGGTGTNVDAAVRE